MQEQIGLTFVVFPILNLALLPVHIILVLAIVIMCLQEHQSLTYVVFPIQALALLLLVLQRTGVSSIESTPMIALVVVVVVVEVY